MATRSEWPEVVGSRCSMAVTEAWTNASKRFRIRWMRVGVLEGHRGLAGERLHELLGPPSEGDDRLVDERDGPQHRGGVALLVDELDDADHVVLVVLHGHDQHRLRAVARLLVEGAADVVGRALGRW